MNLLIFPVIVFLGLMNYFRGAIHDLFLDVLLCLVLAATVFSIQRFNADKIVYRFSLFVWFSIAFYGAAVGIGFGSALYWLLIAPVMLFFFFERKEGLIWVGISAFLAGVLVLFPSLLGTYSYGLYHRIGFCASFLIIAGIGYGIETNRSRYSQMLAEERDALALETERLQGALAEIKTLNGMLPICARCKKIRDDKGYWQQVEAYIQDRSDATFTHGICPQCVEEYWNETEKE